MCWIQFDVILSQAYTWTFSHQRQDLLLELLLSFFWILSLNSSRWLYTFDVWGCLVTQEIFSYVLIASFFFLRWLWYLWHMQENKKSCTHDEMRFGGWSTRNGCAEYGLTHVPLCEGWGAPACVQDLLCCWLAGWWQHTHDELGGSKTLNWWTTLV